MTQAGEVPDRASRRARNATMIGRSLPAAALPALDRRRALFNKGKIGPPNQRTISENPGPARHCAGKLTFLMIIKGRY